MALACAPAAASADSARAGFTRAWKRFHRLEDNPGKAKYRSYWLKLEEEFQDVYRQDKDGEFAPKALYYCGRVYEELGDRSFLASDYRKAVKRYSQAAARFPNHRWIDDCIYRRGLIRLKKLHEDEQAYADFLTVVHDYPKGDMRSKARQAIRDMDREIPSKARSVATSVSSSDGDARLLAVRYNTNDEYTRVVLDVDEDVKYRYNLLKPVPELGRPHRVYVDLEGTRVGGKVHPEIKVADGNLRRIRSAQHDPDTSRVVLDFHNLQEYKIFPLNNPFRIVVDVFAPPEGSKPDPVAEAKRTAKKKKKAANYKPPKGSKKMVDSLVEQLGLTIETIMLDPGHGGKDPGAHSNGLLEKDINLRFAKILGKMLEKRGFKVLYTRTDDSFIPLEERTAKANMNKVDMFISIHCNAHKMRSIHGLETYSLNLARSRDAVRVAARENAVSPKRISDLQMILTDLMLSSKMKESAELASRVQVKTVDKLRKRWKVKDHGTREAPFYVLMGAKMPAVLLEMGYVTNPSEARRLKSDSYLKALARGVVGGVVAYKRQIERFAER